jgi:hypothetical protein
MTSLPSTRSHSLIVVVSSVSSARNREQPDVGQLAER